MEVTAKTLLVTVPAHVEVTAKTLLVTVPAHVEVTAKTLLVTVPGQVEVTAKTLLVTVPAHVEVTAKTLLVTVPGQVLCQKIKTKNEQNAHDFVIVLLLFLLPALCALYRQSSTWDEQGRCLQVWLVAVELGPYWDCCRPHCLSHSLSP